MHKLKTSKSILKRFKINSKNKCFRRSACRSHLLQKKSTKRKHRLKNTIHVKKVNYLVLKSKML